ncbi:MAG: hypothetical protein H7Y38_16175 [Armatimonadetes bacterium]|nr:hypothetical protein [Armatimonadota bacterium]
MIKRCGHCGGADLASASLKAGNADAQIVIAGHPDGFLGVIPYTKSPIRAYVCRDCGYTMLFAEQMTDLLALNAQSDTKAEPPHVGF